MITVEMYGSLQKKKCFGCGSVISFDNGDIEYEEVEGTKISFVTCPVCHKKIKAKKIDRANGQPVGNTKKVSEVGKKAQQALDEADTEWDEEVTK